MKKFMALLPALSLLLLFMLVPPISDAQAATPMVAAGTITAGNYAFTGMKSADGNTFITGVYDQDVFTGTLSGTAPNEFRLILNPSGMNVQIYFTFTGTVDGKSGTLTLKFQGHGDGIGLPIQGKLVILSGTGDLANLHGVLDAEGIAGVMLHYSGMLHFGPK